MHGVRLSAPAADFMSHNGFFDGQQVEIPDNTELQVVVVDGYSGFEESRGISVCYLTLMVSSAGAYYGQKYRYNLKVFDEDSQKRDLAFRNLQVVDAQAGFPLTRSGVELDADFIAQHYSGRAFCRAKFGLFVADDGKRLNFIRGLGFDREKMIPSTQAAPQSVHAPQPQQPASRDAEEDIPF